MDITFEEVGFTYQKGTPFENRALYAIDMTIKEGSFTALVGHTGSGKSTVLQHLNALMKPTEGTVTIGERIITPTTNNKNLKSIRKQVGIVFQFPEAQLFEETVAKDIAFGPKNFGVPEAEAIELARKMLPLVGLDEIFMERSPFDLSGGQMRRVAIAGVLAMEPQVLVLDEPTAGLDPQGRREMMEMFYDLHREKGLTIVLVTHQMDDVANYADHMVILEKGTVIREGAPQEIFQDGDWLKSKQLGVPAAVSFGQLLQAKLPSFNERLLLTTNELADAIAAQVNALTANERHQEPTSEAGEPK
ncbi:energy-coupling factor ABC transporter ATP-binding protein [Carnobacterium antarcticum]|uniref:Energy-coupling factor transporter ATP-binding protein EcfA2 n=1 Tax=Carnobacterium antarcticum TaxID=2126436 RepID=A0ABW4NL07_9LACT|nr:energy-coupling factor ABC transporter ATP-binding protein [Carnobacterium sp. CP1]ALV22244.1 ATPase component of general energizing module of ECF transporters [Carnobacterium sp. CP1]